MAISVSMAVAISTTLLIKGPANTLSNMIYLRKKPKDWNIPDNYFELN